MKRSNAKQFEYFQITKLLSNEDKIKLLLVSIIQICLSAIDLIAVAFFGLIGSVSVSAISSSQITGRTADVIRLIGIDDLSNQNQVIILGITATILMVVKTFVSLYFNKRIIFYLSRRSAIISTNLILNLFKKQFNDVKKQGTQKLIYSLTDGVDAVTIKVLGSTVILIADFSLLILLLIGLLIANTLMTMILIIIFGLIGFTVYTLSGKKIKSIGEINAEFQIKSVNRIFEAVGSYKELVLRGQRNFYAFEIGSARLSQATTNAQLSYMQHINKYIMEASIVFVTIVIAGVQFAIGSALRSVSTLTLFFAAISRIAPAILRIQQNLLILRAGIGQAKSTLELISELNLSINNSDSRVLVPIADIYHKNFESNIKTKNLCFKYDKQNKFVLSDVNLDFESGNLIAIVGPTGAGKSTLVDLLLGLHSPTSGEVRISNRNAVEAISNWPGAVAYVPQEIQLTEGTILTNVLLGFENNDFNYKLALDALKKSELQEFITDQDKIIDLDIGRHSGTLSGGQRQRIGIARALLTNPKILVLDEATSALDAQTEEKISNTLNKLKYESLVIVVAHRLATVRNADLVVYIEEGKIKAQGNFDHVRSTVPNFDTQAQLMGL